MLDPDAEYGNKEFVMSESSSRLGEKLEGEAKGEKAQTLKS